MLKIHTYLDRSATHGIGIFAAEDIPEGTLVWEYNPRVDLTYSPEEWQSLKATVAPASFTALERYSYKENDCFHLCIDNAQFMNHSDSNYNVVNTAHNTMLARCDIRRGEELLCNYFQYSDADDVHAERLAG
ncbi:MAG: SET domain-containing protein [Thermodesulfobacteriota bacterium]